MEPLLRIRQVPGKGRGVFANRRIRKGAVIETAPVLVIPVEHLPGGKFNPALGKYVYEWARKKVALCLGYGSLYNHSYRPNADYEHERAAIRYRALRAIEAGEEITINYNGNPKNKGPVGFEVVSIRKKKTRRNQPMRARAAK